MKELRKRMLPQWLRPIVSEAGATQASRYGLAGFIGTTTLAALCGLIAIFPATLLWLAPVIMLGYLICAVTCGLCCYDGESDLTFDVFLAAAFFPVLFWLTIPTVIVTFLFRSRSFDERTRESYKQLASVTDLTKATPEFYVCMLGYMENEAIGEQAPLNKIRSNLQQRIERVATLGMRILSRISHTTDEGRRERLRLLHKEQQDTLQRLNKTLVRHNDVIVRAKACFDECRAQTRLITEQMEDDRLIDELRKEHEASVSIEQQSADAIHGTMETIFGRMSELHSGLRVRIANDANLFQNDHEDLEQEFARYERLAEAAYGITAKS